jgi:hypothetical protein
MLDSFASLPHNVEHVAYLDGVRLGDELAVGTTVVIPNATLEQGRYRVEPDNAAEAGRHMFELNITRLAQIHTHPNDHIAHSRVDDANAYSQQLGSLSIVLPFHARNRPTPNESGVHVRQSGGWNLMDASMAASYVSLLPSILDFRPPTERRRRWWQKKR